jgi:hypothetical protein
MKSEGQSRFSENLKSVLKNDDAFCLSSGKANLAIPQWRDFTILILDIFLNMPAS